MDEKLPGVSVPAALIEALEAAGDDAPTVGIERAVPLVSAIRAIPDIAGIHVMAMGHDDATRALVRAAGLAPRPAV